MARDIHYAESLGEDTTTSGTYQDKVTLTFTPQASTDYILLWSAEVICQDTTTDVFARLYNSTDAVQYSEQNLENRTTSGTPYRIVHGIAKYTGSGSPSSTSFKIQYKSESGTNCTIRKASVLAISMESDDEYAESLSDQTTTSNTYVDGVTLTFTPASQGDYMIFASCDWNHGSTADVIWLKLLDSSSSDVSEMKTHNRDATNYNPYTTFIKQNLTAASKTFKLQVHRSSANTITLRNQRIFAMRMDNGFDNVYYAEDRTGGTTTSTSYQDKNSLTQTTNAADHIIINMSGFTSSSTSISTNEQFLEDGSVIRGPLEARSNSSGGNNFYYPVFRVRHATLTGASHTWKNQYKSGGIGNTAGIDELATAVLEYTVASGAYTLTATQASFTLTGQAATLKASRLVTATQASYTLTGQAANLLHGYTLSLTNGSFTLSGQDAGLAAQRLITAVQASYTLTGQDAAFYRGYPLIADYGSFTLTGQDANLVPARKITADYGSFTLTGNATGLIADRLISLTHGTFTLTGQDANLAQGYGFAVDYGSFTLTGQDAGLTAQRVLTADYGSFTLSGQDAVITAGEILTAEQATFTLTGQDAALTAGRTLAADYAAFTLTGGDVTFTYTPSAGAETIQGGGFAVYDRDAGRRSKAKERDKLKAAMQKAIEALDPAKVEPEVKEIIKAVKTETAKLDAIKYEQLPAFDFTPLYEAVKQLEQVAAERAAFMRDEEEAIIALLLTMH